MRRAVPSVPTRDTNPFATCWTRPGAIPFVFAGDQTAAGLVTRLAELGWRAEIVGPHGSGKSTLVAALLPEVRDAGFAVHSITLRDGQRWLPRAFWQRAFGARWQKSSMRPESSDGTTSLNRFVPSVVRPLLVIDGYEQLHWLQRWWLKRRCRRAGAGLLVTSHASTGLATLVTLAPDRQLVERLVALLCQRGSSSIDSADVAASAAVHGSNVREIFFDLYDRHETMRSGQ
jgi:hypothetical protein